MVIKFGYSYFQIQRPVVKFFHSVKQLKYDDQKVLFVNDLLLIVIVEFHLEMLAAKQIICFFIMRKMI